MNAWRLLNLPLNQAPLFNMALDLALLQLHAAGASPPTLRFYQWDPPAVSLGRFQPVDTLDAAACQRLGLEVVRRPTGGQAVLHLRDLSYAVVAGPHDGLSASPMTACRLLGGGLLRGLRRLGVEAEAGPREAGHHLEGLCLLGAARGDLLYRGRKFAGSAQKILRRVSLLQHGSMALEPQGELAAEMCNLPKTYREEMRASLRARTTALSRILPHPVPGADVAAALCRGLAEQLGVVLRPEGLTPHELALTQEIMARTGVSRPLPASPAGPAAGKGAAAHCLGKGSGEQAGA
ncbi:MAG: biotin/lipoate A/B protein ligase family protein [Pseudomonadota bacterium]